jgi:FkbM family methyltransferase
MKKIGNMHFPDRDVQDGGKKARYMVKHGYYYEAIEEAMSYANDKSIAIDGGANVGFWAKKMAEAFDEVHAFEIDPETFGCLCENVREENNVVVYNMGLSNTEHKVKIADGWNQKSMGTHLEPENNVTIRRQKSTIRNVEVNTATIDSLDLPSLGFVKLDVEGHEAQVIEGGHESLMKYKPIVMIEYKPELNKRYGTADPAQLLENMGAKLIDKIGKNNVEWIYGW